MKIAVYHNLEQGGGLESLKKISEEFAKKNVVDVYSHKASFPINKNIKEIIFPIKSVSNIFQSLLQIIFELNNVSQEISRLINSGQYDLVIVGQCILTQSPYILRYLDKDIISIYIFHESKREFYEKTSFDHFSLRRTFARIIRLPIKFIDKYNCSKGKTIISNSVYTSFQLKKIYNKSSFVIYPGLLQVSPIKKIVTNNKRLISIGSLSYIKGHSFSVSQIANTTMELDIIGRNTNESGQIMREGENIMNHVRFLNCESYKKKLEYLKTYSLYLANQFAEPFGISTLEASSQNCYVIGLNEGGSSEICSIGLDGFLYPRNINLAIKILSGEYKKSKITLYSRNSINWAHTAENILSIYHTLTHTPNE